MMNLDILILFDFVALFYPVPLFLGPFRLTE